MARGRGHTKIEQDGIDRQIKSNHGSPIIYLPKSLLGLGMYFDQEVTVQREEGKNPLSWKIIIKPKEKEAISEQQRVVN